MKAFCCVVAVAGLLISAPAMAQQAYGTGGGNTNIWSSAQGSSDSYGNANGFGTSSSGAMAIGGGRGSLGAGAGSVGGGITSAMTTSYAGAATSGSGYVQVQTSGYAGGTVAGFAGHTR
jgi:hypothetical protein